MFKNIGKKIKPKRKNFCAILRCWLLKLVYKQRSANKFHNKWSKIIGNRWLWINQYVIILVAFHFSPNILHMNLQNFKKFKEKIKLITNLMPRPNIDFIYLYFWTLKPCLMRISIFLLAKHNLVVHPILH